MAKTQTASVALVTGVGRAGGIGHEVCRQLARRGTTVLLTARSLDKAGPLAEALAADGLDVRPFALDVADAGSVRRLADEVRRAVGRLDALVNNAAVLGRTDETPSTADLAAAHAVFEAVLYGAWRTCQEFLPLLKDAPAGRIVNVTSGAGSHGDPQFGLASGFSMGPSYAVSKAALNALTAAFARELKGTAVLVNAVCPGFTATFPGAEAMGARPVADGAAGIVWAATLPADGPTGGFFRDGRPIPW